MSRGVLPGDLALAAGVHPAVLRPCGCGRDPAVSGHDHRDAEEMTWADRVQAARACGNAPPSPCLQEVRRGVWWRRLCRRGSTG